MKCPLIEYEPIVGWDFSSRWFADEMTLGSIRASDVVPVDLNSIMYRFEHNMAAFCAQGDIYAHFHRL